MTRTDPPTLTPEERYEQLVEQSPSAKYVYSELRREGPTTQDGLVGLTWLPKRTVQYALERLVEERLVEPRVDADDARCRTYAAKSIRPTGGETAGE